MRLYNCLVNVGGVGDTNQPTTVQKIAVSAAEVLTLRAIHGEEAVTSIKTGAMDKRGHTAERKSLDDKYGRARTTELFGPPIGAKLPTELEGDFLALDLEDQDKPFPLDFGMTAEQVRASTVRATNLAKQAAPVADDDEETAAA